MKPDVQLLVEPSVSLNRQRKIMALEVLKCKYSYRSCESESNRFCSMFSDNNTAKNFTCEKTKCSYILCHGIAPFVKESVINELKEVPYYTTLFDKSYNKICKKSQMDLHVRYWDDTACEFRTSHWTSEFLGKASVDDVLFMYDAFVSQLDKSKILQISSDGFNVNVAFLGLAQESRKEELLDPLINIGTCCLHILHRSFQTGEKATD